MTIRCPNCERPLDLPQWKSTESGVGILQTLTSISCPNCGMVQVELQLDPTLTFQQSTELRKGTSVAHFRLIRLLGQGSFGEVWLADDINLGREVALKLPHSQGREISSLIHEAKTAASLHHPHIVSVYEVGVEHGQVFIASEYIDGITLRDLLSAGKPSLDRTIELLTAIARALHYAHQHQVVHRDVKPANILLSKEGQPYIADFGIAKRIATDATISNEGQVIGTARYMSPEQASGKTRETDHRADVYALGVILFEMLTGDVPFRGNMRALLHQKIFEDPPSPRTFDPAVPRDLETICLKCLEREPEKRLPSALELAEELGRFASGEPIRSRPVSRLEHAWRWCRKRPAISSLLAGLFLSLTFGLLGVTTFWRQAEHSADVARQSLYRSLMNLAAVHLTNGDNAGVRELLGRVAGDPKMARLRGFEWYYFDTLTSSLKVVANTGDVVRDLALSRDGDLCASAGPGKDIQVWDTRTGELVRTLRTDVEGASSVDFSPTSLVLATGSADGYLRLWNPSQDARPVHVLEHGPPVQLVQFSPDGRRVLSLGKKGAARVWDAATGQKTAELPTGMRSPPKEARFINADTVLVGTEDGRLRLWDLNNIGAPPVPKLELDAGTSLESLAVSDDGQWLMVGGYYGVIAALSLTDGQKRTLQTIWGRADDIEFLPGQHVAAVVCSDGKTHFYDLDQQRELRSQQTHSFNAARLARAANGKSLVVGGGDGAITLLPIGTSRASDILWHDSTVRDVEFLPDGRRLVVATERDGVWLWDLDRQKSQLLDPNVDPTVRTLSVQPKGRWMALAGSEPDVQLWDLEQQRVARTLSAAPTGAFELQFSPSGRMLALVTRKGSVRLYQSDDFAPRFELPEREQRANALCFSPDERLLAVAWSNDQVEWLDTSTGAPHGTPITLKAEPVALEFCAAQGVLVIGTASGELLLWDLTASKARTVIKGHTGRINALASLPGGTTLLSAGRDRNLKLWDLPTGELITPLAGHLRQVFSAAVSPDGRTVASGGLEGDVRLWASQKVH